MWEHAQDAGHGELQTDSMPVLRNQSAANGTEEMLESSEAETYRSIVGILMYFASRGKVPGNGEFFTDQGVA